MSVAPVEHSSLISLATRWGCPFPDPSLPATLYPPACCPSCEARLDKEQRGERKEEIWRQTHWPGTRGGSQNRGLVHLSQGFVEVAKLRSRRQALEEQELLSPVCLAHGSSWRMPAEQPNVC